MQPKMTFEITYPELEQTVHKYIRFKKPGDNHFYVKCNEIVINELGIRCSCAMEPTREDHFKKWLLKNTHQCKPGDPINQLTLDELWTKQQEESHIITQESLYKDMAIFTGKKNLSLEVLSSQQFYDLACKFIQFGTQFPKIADPVNEIPKRFKRLKRDKLRCVLIDTANMERRKALKRFAQCTYTCLALDEGTTASKKNLHFVLECRVGHHNSFPCRTIQMKAGKAKDYVEAIRKGLRFINAADIKIGCVVCDGNTAQKKAFNHDWKGSLYRKNVTGIKNVIFVPCLCHRLHNAYKNQVSHIKELKEIVTHLHATASTVHDNFEDIGPGCPTHCETRWLYDYDILNYLLKHSQQIKKTLPDIPIDKYIDLYKCLKVYKCLVKTFESPETSLHEAFPLLEKGIKTLFQLHYEQNNRYSYSLAISLQNYTLNSADGTIWSLAYSFIPSGREDFWNRNSDRANATQDNNLEYFHVEEESEVDDEFLDYFKSVEQMTIEGYESETSDYDYVPSTEEEYEEEDELEFENDEIIVEKNENFKDYVQCAKDALHTFLVQRGLPKEEVLFAISTFNEYLDSPKDALEEYKYKSIDGYSWMQMKRAITGMNDVADIAMRLNCSTTSEASCERTIKRQRKIHSPLRMRSDPDLLDARMTLNSL